MTDLLNKRLEAKHRYNQRSPLAVRTKDGRSMLISPLTGPHVFMADPEFWRESGVIKFFWGTEFPCVLGGISCRNRCANNAAGPICFDIWNAMKPAPTLASVTSSSP
jgi:hypothetical protein